MSDDDDRSVAEALARSGSGSREAFRLIASVTVLSVMNILPLFLIGAMAVQIAADTGITPASLGLGAGAFLGTQAAMSAVCGPLADRIGPARALRLSGVIAAIGCFGTAGLASGSTGLIVALAVGGLANAIGQPAASAMLSRIIQRGRQGLAFGIFQSSKPAAAFCAGLLVPLVALTVGWRWGYVLAGLGAIAACAVLPRGGGPRSVRPPAPSGGLPIGPLLLLLLASALAFGAVSVLPVFLVDSLVSTGFAAGFAGLVLSAVSVMSICARLASGYWVDRGDRTTLPIVSGMLCAGGVAFVLMASGIRPLVLVGAILAGASAWGFHGLYYLGMTRLRPSRPAEITGLMLSGGSLGGALAPALMGLVAEHGSYASVWAGTAVVALCAAVLLEVGRRWFLAAVQRGAPMMSPRGGSTDERQG